VSPLDEKRDLTRDDARDNFYSRPFVVPVCQLSTLWQLWRQVSKKARMLADNPASVRSQTSESTKRLTWAESSKSSQSWSRSALRSRTIQSFPSWSRARTLLPRARTLFVLLRFATSSSSADYLVPRTSRRCSRWRCRALDTHIRCAAVDIADRSLPQGDSGRAPGRSSYRDLPARSRQLYHREAQVTREWTKPADRADRLPADWAPLTAGPSRENGARLGATSTWEPGMWASPAEPILSRLRATSGSK